MKRLAFYGPLFGAVALSFGQQTTPPAAPAAAQAEEKKTLATDPAIDARFETAVGDAAELSSAVLGKTITLGEALRITLFRQPTIDLAAEDLAIAKSAVLLAAAPFDVVAQGEFRHGRTYRPQTTNEILAQIQARQAAAGDLSASQAQLLSASADQLARQAQVLDLLTGSPVSRANLLSAQANSAAAGQLAALQREQLAAQITALTSRDIQTTIRDGQTNYTLGLNKLMRNGITVNPHLDWNRLVNENTASINLDFVVPLAQGRGAITERAIEDAARVDLEASKWQLRHEIATALFNTSVAFWNLLAAQQDYALLRDSESIADTFSDLSGLRFEKQEISAGDAAIADARLADATAQRIAAEFAVFSARQQLALAMGFAGEELIEPPFAAGELPNRVNVDGIAGLEYDNVMRKSLILRDDQRAAIQAARSGKIIARAAKFDQKPIVDMFFQLAYTGVDDGTHFENSFSAFSDDKTALGAFGGVSLEWPLQLSASRANYQQTSAIYRQRVVSAMDLERNIVSSVNLALNQIKSTHAQIAAFERSASFSRKSLEAERALFNAGELNLLDSIQLEQQYTLSLRNLIVAYLNHITGVSALRFQSGTLLEPSEAFEPETVSFTVQNLTTIPNWSAYPGTPIQPVATGFDKPAKPLLKRGQEDAELPPLPVVEDKPTQPEPPKPLLRKLFGKTGE